MVNNSTTSNSNIFSEFPKYPLGGSVVAKNINSNNQLPDNIKKWQTLTKNNSSVNNNAIYMSDIAEIKKEKKRRRIFFGSTVASTIATAGVISLLLAKGVHGSSLKSGFSKFKKKLVEDLHNASQNASNSIGGRVSYGAKKTLNSMLDALQASSNFTTFKDWSMDSVLRTNKVTGSFADGTTSMFKKIVDRTLGKKYAKVDFQVKNLVSLIKECELSELMALDDAQKAAKITIKGQTKTLSEWIELLNKHTLQMESVYDSNFSLGALRSRDKKRTLLLTDIKDKLKERFFGKGLKSFFDINNYKTYSTEDVSKEAHDTLSREILRARKQVTNNILSISDEMKHSVSKFTDVIKPSDTSSRIALQELKRQLDVFKIANGADEQQIRKEASEKILSLLDEISSSVSGSNTYREDEVRIINNLIDDVKKIASSGDGSSKGSLEEIMTILKGFKDNKIISGESFKEYGKMSSAISQGMKDATELEMGEYFLKQAELKVGSSPNDVLSILFPVGVGAYAIAKGDDKDEKVSATLTTCIPLIGTFATFVYGTVKMFSGAKNLIFSAISGVLLSEMGNYADKLYKKYKDTGSITDVVKGEYDKFWTGLEPQIHQFEEPEKKKK